ncbi:5'-nucleotidase C-terminal domain-containing protein [Limibacter armeniacum]|uniref:5'-nucleotidase C-terminal domain-containing protein n=1 Tax=Limibacter armeniacum TaxID=466084 RepID=UPI002FE5A1B8
MMNKLKYLLIGLSIAFFANCKGPQALLKTSAETVAVSQQLKPDTTLENLVHTYKVELDKEMNQVITFAKTDLFKGKPEGKLGNLICDLSIEIAEKHGAAPIDLCIMNNGGFRAPIYQGDVTKRTVFELMPFDNSLMVATLSGDGMKEFLAYLCEKPEAVSGLKMTIDNGSPVSVMINGQPFDPDKSYRVLTTDYLYNGGSRMYFFQKSTKTDDLGLLLRDAIMEYFVEADTISADIENRIQIAETANQDQ